MVLHAMKKFKEFRDYDPYAPISYPDWDQPLVHTFHDGATTGIYIGCPVGKYRKYIVDAIVDSLLDLHW